MGNMPPYQPDQPPDEQPDQPPVYRSGQEHEYQPERPHDAQQDQPPTYPAEQTRGDQTERPHDYRLDQPTGYQPASMAANRPYQAPDYRPSEQVSAYQQAQHLRVRRRPCGVVLMSLFLLAQGVFLMVAGVFGVLGLIVLVFDLSRGSTLLMHGLFSFALGLLSIIFAFGMFMLTRWAFWAAVIIAFFNLMMSLTVLLQTGFASFGHIISGIFSLVVLSYFLFDSDARAAFTKEAPSLVEF